jgi:hypothetical protein
MMDIHLLAEEMRDRIAELRRCASRDRLVRLAEGGRGRRRRPALAAWLAAVHRLDAPKLVALLFPRGRLPTGDR